MPKSVCPIGSTNYHLSGALHEQSDKISISATPLGDGWTVEASFPRRASDEDRVNVLNWMMAYRSNIRDAHPLWDVSFHSGRDRFRLVVTPEGCDADMKRTARNKANALFDDVVQSYG